MLKIIRRKLKEKKGEFYIDFSLSLFIILIVVGFVLELYPIYTKKNDLNTFANELVRTVGIYGQVGAEVEQRIENLKQSLHVDPIIEYDKTKVDLDEEFTITVSEVYTVDLGSFFTYKINLKSKASGIGEVYWK